MLISRKAAALAAAGVGAAAGIGAALLLKAHNVRRQMDMDGRVVVITGESRGLGLVIAREFARAGARSAARQILQACRNGDPQLVISPQAKALTLSSALFPGATAKVTALVSRLLPGTGGEEGNELRSGWDSQSPIAPSILTWLADREAPRNNELRDQEK